MILPALLLLLAAADAPPAPAPAAPTPPATPAADKAPARPALLAVATEVAGNTKFRPDPEAAWQPLAAGTPLPVGAEVLAGPGGQATLQLGPGVVVRLKPFSRITIARLELNGDADTQRAQLAKQYGRLEFDVREVGFKNDFRISSPTGVMAVRGTGGEHINHGGELWVEGVKTNKTHAIEVQELLRAYAAWLSANEAWSSELPTVEAFERWLAESAPVPTASWSTLEANVGRAGDDPAADLNQAAGQFGAFQPQQGFRGPAGQ